MRLRERFGCGAVSRSGLPALLGAYVRVSKSTRTKNCSRATVPQLMKSLTTENIKNHEILEKQEILMRFPIGFESASRSRNARERKRRTAMQGAIRMPGTVATPLMITRLVR